jgi:hypothetical protein
MAELAKASVDYSKDLGSTLGKDRKNIFFSV